MGLSSSTSSSKKLPVGWLAILLIVTLSAWMISIGLGASLAERGASAFGSSIERYSKGSVVDVKAFIENRIRDAAYLITLLSLAIAIGALVRQWFEKRVSRTFLWVPLSLYVFVAFNLLLIAACGTASFWGVLFVALPNLKQSGFHLRRTLVAESRAPNRGVIIGSSQGGSEINDAQMSQALSPNWEFGNLSYAGSGAADFLLLQEQYSSLKPRIVVCYLSEMNLYRPAGIGRFIPFLGPRSARDLRSIDLPEIQSSDFAVGLAGYAVPAFRVRRALELAIFGSESGDLKAARGIKRTLEQVAEETAKQYECGAGSEAQKRAFERFLENNIQADSTTVVVAGQVHPLLEGYIADEVKDDFKSFLAGLDKFGSKVVVLQEMPRHAAAAYGNRDLMHILPEERTAFTAELLSRIQFLTESSGATR